MPMALKLVDNAFRCLQSRLDMLNRIVIVHMLELIIQNAELGLNLTKCSVINQHDLFVAVRAFSACF